MVMVVMGLMDINLSMFMMAMGLLNINLSIKERCPCLWWLWAY